MREGLGQCGVLGGVVRERTRGPGDRRWVDPECWTYREGAGFGSSGGDDGEHVGGDVGVSGGLLFRGGEEDEEVQGHGVHRGDEQGL